MLLTSIQWAEARNGAKYPTIHRIALTTKNYPVQNVSSAKIKRLNIEFLGEISAY